MDRPDWIDDEVTRSAVELFQNEIEVFILSVFQEDADAGYAKIKAARDYARQNIKNWELNHVAGNVEVEIKRRALNLIDLSFDRMMEIAQAIGDDRSGQ